MASYDTLHEKYIVICDHPGERNSPHFRRMKRDDRHGRIDRERPHGDIGSGNGYGRPLHDSSGCASGRALVGDSYS